MPFDEIDRRQVSSSHGYQRKLSQSVATLREASPLQNGWIFGKVPNGLWPPPPSFSENYIADFATKMRDFATKVRMFIIISKSAYVHYYFPWDACSTTVQHGNWLKSIPRKDPFVSFSCWKSPILKVQIMQYNFLELFPKIHAFRYGSSSLIQIAKDDIWYKKLIFGMICKVITWNRYSLQSPTAAPYSYPQSVRLIQPTPHHLKTL